MHYRSQEPFRPLPAWIRVLIAFAEGASNSTDLVKKKVVSNSHGSFLINVLYRHGFVDVKFYGSVNVVTLLPKGKKVADAAKTIVGLMPR